MHFREGVMEVIQSFQAPMTEKFRTSTFLSGAKSQMMEVFREMVHDAVAKGNLPREMRDLCHFDFELDPSGDIKIKWPPELIEFIVNLPTRIDDD